jgi:hypothetical protein
MAFSPRTTDSFIVGNYNAKSLLGGLKSDVSDLGK